MARAKSLSKTLDKVPADPYGAFGWFVSRCASASPEIVVAKILGDQPLIPSARARQRLAHKITTALRAAGWRILRS